MDYIDTKNITKDVIKLHQKVNKPNKSETIEKSAITKNITSNIVINKKSEKCIISSDFKGSTLDIPQISEEHLSVS